MLLLHGILGTPRHFDFLLPLIPGDWSIHAPLLPGHGGKCGDFAGTDMAEWKRAVDKALAELCESHERVYIVGHSMGSLLAVWAALRHPEKVCGIFALAMPLRIRFTLRAALACLHAAFRSPDKDTPFLRATRQSSSIALSKNPFAYIGWIPRFLELFALSREIRLAMDKIKTPCLAIQSAKDELVSPSSLKYTGSAETVVLPDSSHYFYSESDLETIKFRFHDFIK